MTPPLKPTASGSSTPSPSLKLSTTNIQTRGRQHPRGRPLTTSSLAALFQVAETKLKHVYILKDLTFYQEVIPNGTTCISLCHISLVRFHLNLTIIWRSPPFKIFKLNTLNLILLYLGSQRQPPRTSVSCSYRYLFEPPHSFYSLSPCPPASVSIICCSLGKLSFWLYSSHHPLTAL